MEVHLTPRQEAFLDQKVLAGRFTSREDALRKAVDLLDKQESVLDDAGHAVDEADEDFAQGRYAVYTDDTLRTLAEELKQEARAAQSSL